LVFDTINYTSTLLKTKGINVRPRMDHNSCIIGQSMFTFSGQFENGIFNNELLSLDLEFCEWSTVSCKNNIEPLIQSACCAVTL